MIEARVFLGATPSGEALLRLELENAKVLLTHQGDVRELTLPDDSAATTEKLLKAAGYSATALAAPQGKTLFFALPIPADALPGLLPLQHLAEALQQRGSLFVGLITTDAFEAALRALRTALPYATLALESAPTDTQPPVLASTEEVGSGKISELSSAIATQIAGNKSRSR
jgi:hypothetical protein